LGVGVGGVAVVAGADQDRADLLLEEGDGGLLAARSGFGGAGAANGRQQGQRKGNPEPRDEENDRVLKLSRDQFISPCGVTMPGTSRLVKKNQAPDRRKSPV